MGRKVDEKTQNINYYTLFDDRHLKFIFRKIIMNKMMKKGSIAYFSMEFGLEGLPCAGGLGVLSGDYVKSCADLGLPVVGVSLLYNQGNFHQKLSDDGDQTEWYDRFDPTGIMRYHFNDVSVPIEGRNVFLNSWRFDVRGERGIVPIYFIDTNGNNHDRPWDDNICNVIYPSNPYQRLTQEQVLCRGGVKTLDKLGYEIKKYHLNEGHTAMTTLELIEKYGNVEEAKKHIIFNTHSPVPACIDVFSRNLAEQVLGQGLPSREYMINLTGTDCLDMLRLGMSVSSKKFAVSPLHAKVSKCNFKNIPNVENIFSIDNGVHLPTWTAPEVQKLYDGLTDRKWRSHPETLIKVLDISDEVAIEVHRRSRERLGEFLGRDPRVKGNKKYDPEKLTIGFARRITEYKQPTLIFDQIDRLKKLGNDIQIIFSGKAHPNDDKGKLLIKRIFEFKKELEGVVTVFYIEDYDMQIEKYLVRGVDLWLNTPRRLNEASGTSGMKAACNFIPQISIPDGWWMPNEHPRGLIEGITGWKIGRIPDESDFQLLITGNEADVLLRLQEDRKKDSEDLYNKLEYEIIPLFKNHKTSVGKNNKSWAKVMKGAAAINGSHYNSHRMVREYFEKLYSD